LPAPFCKPRCLGDDPDEFNKNLIALGDFNIGRQGDPTRDAFAIENGLSPPDKLLELVEDLGAAIG
jgi:hypothetical protein